MTALRIVRLGLAASLLPLAGCQAWHHVALGTGGRPVAQVREGTPVELAFAAPRRVAAPGLPDRVIRLRGQVQRARADTLFVRVDEAAVLGGELRGVARAPVAPVVVDRNVAVRLRERSRSRTLLAVVGVAALVAVVMSSR